MIDEIVEIAQIVARRLSYAAGKTPETDPLYEDMVQAATIKMWQLSNGDFASVRHWRNKMYIAAKGAAIEEIKRYIDNIPRDGVLYELCDKDWDVSLRALYQVMIEGRKKGGKRGSKAAVRDAKILKLILRGCDNATIADKMNLPVRSVREYRRRIRKMLETIG